MNCLKALNTLLLLALLLLAGCAANLPEYHEQGYGIVIFPGNGSTALWSLQGEKSAFAPKFVDVGGGYCAAVLEPGVYRLSGVYNVEKRSALGRGNKDLDYFGRERGESIPPDEIENSLGLAQVKRLAIKETRGEGRFGSEHTVDVSSEYRISLALPDVPGGTARFEVGAGQVLLLPALRGEITLDERACSRKGTALISYTPFILFDNPEDFQILEWYCALGELALTLVPASPDALKAGADPKKLPPELLGKLEARELRLGAWFQKARKGDAGEPGPVKYVFSGP